MRVSLRSISGIDSEKNEIFPRLTPPLGGGKIKKKPRHRLVNGGVGTSRDRLKAWREDAVRAVAHDDLS